jgi:hypothetical protein
VQVVVVLNRSLVFVVNLSDELEELVMIDSLQQVVVLEQWRSHEGHLHVTANWSRELKNIEVKGKDLLIEVLVLHDQLVDFIYGEIKVNLIRVDSNWLKVCGSIGSVMTVCFHLLLCLL